MRHRPTVRHATRPMLSPQITGHFMIRTRRIVASLHRNQPEVNRPWCPLCDSAAEYGR